MSDNTSTAPKSELSVENHTEVRIAPSYDHAGITIYNGDALEILRQLPDATVNCCITSPPYWGLRDYGTATWDGGDTECDHLQVRVKARWSSVADKRRRIRSGYFGWVAAVPWHLS
jgi:DNA modification methylase